MATEVEYVNYKDFVADLESTENPGVDDVTVVSNSIDGPRTIPANTSALTNVATEADLTSSSTLELQTPTGKKKLRSDLLAQKALAGNVAPVFDPNKPDDAGGYAYYAGTPVIYNSSNYVFTSNKKSGAWDPSVVEKKPLSESIQLEGVGEAVNAWLDNHPQATTTVEDSSLTEAKFSDDLKLQTINNYVKPEMFGAVGDGVTDDTSSFSLAIEYVSAYLDGYSIVGTRGKRYCINNLTVQHAKIKNCSFVPLSNNSDGINLKSHSVIENCSFTGFRRAVVCTSGSVASFLIRNLFSYCTRCGLYVNCYNGISVNSLSVDGNYFNRHGSGSQDPIEDDNGCGIFVDGNAFGIYVTNNVFEYNASDGIRITNSGSYRPSIFVFGNYFEGNSKAAVRLINNLNYIWYISIHDNVFSYDSFGEKAGVAYEKGYGPYVVEDLFGRCTFRLTPYLHDDLPDFGNTHSKLLDNSLQSLSFTLVILLFKEAPSGVKNYMKVRYYGIDIDESNPVKLKKNLTSEDMIDFKNGYHEEIVPYVTSLKLSRALVGSEKIVIEEVLLLN